MERTAQSEYKFKTEVFFSSLLLLVSLFINFFAGMYSTEVASNPVTDIILSNVPVFDLDRMFVYGSWALVAFIGYVCFRRHKRIPYVFKSIALFVIIRAIFISLTHIGPFPTADVISPTSFIRYFVFGGDLFFSGHTGLPFLMGLLFWDNNRKLSKTFIVISIVLGVLVLLAHLHYTIDVLSAFFISYGIYHMTLIFFKKDRRLFLEGR